MRDRQIKLLNTGSYFISGARSTGKSTVLRTQMMGKKVLMCEFVRLKSYLRRKMNFSHFNTGGTEIDLVIESPGMPDTFVEIKATEKVTEDHYAGLRSLRKDFPKYRYLCLSRDPISRIEEGIEVLPWKEGMRDLLSFK